MSAVDGGGNSGGGGGGAGGGANPTVQTSPDGGALGGGGMGQGQTGYDDWRNTYSNGSKGGSKGSGNNSSSNSSSNSSEVSMNGSSMTSYNQTGGGDIQFGNPTGTPSGYSGGNAGTSSVSGGGNIGGSGYSTSHILGGGSIDGGPDRPNEFRGDMPPRNDYSGYDPGTSNDPWDYDDAGPIKPSFYYGLDPFWKRMYDALQMSFLDWIPSGLILTPVAAPVRALAQFTSVESLLQAVGKLTRLTNSRGSKVFQAVIKGNGQAIFNELVKNGTRMESGAYKIGDYIISQYSASTTGEFTIFINKRTEIIKIRINP